MQCSEAIKLSSAGLEAFQSGKQDGIIAELEKHIDVISSLLTSYHWHEKGIVYGVKIDADSVQIDLNGKGSFVVRYGTNIHYGCSDKDIELDNKMLIAITIDLQTGETVLTGEYIPEREPDGY